MSSMRAVANPTITFGLINISVKAYLTAAEESVRFNWLSPQGNRVKQKLFDANTMEEIERKDTTSGYEVEKDVFISFTEAELELVSGDKQDVIELNEFVCDVDISPTKVERSLYLAPDKSDRSYRLLHHCMRADNKVAIGKWYTKKKDHLVALVADGDLIVMHQLYYNNELRELGINFAQGSEPAEKEIELARSLVDSLTSEAFSISSYQDEYAERIKNAIAVKQSGKKLTARSVKKTQFGLAELLEKSLQRTKK